MKAEGSPSAGGELVIERLADRAEEVQAVDELAKRSFPIGGFSVAEEIKRGWSRIWVARERQSLSLEPFGFLISWHVIDELHVLNVATAPAVRRRGVATALMREAIAYAATTRVRLLLLEVRRSNRAALGLYRRLGFSVTALRAGYYADTGEDAIEMNLTLDPATGLILPGSDEFRVDG
jgi:ribosomal-protein-alanine N-acetyltransferase